MPRASRAAFNVYAEQSVHSLTANECFRCRVCEGTDFHDVSVTELLFCLIEDGVN